MSIAKRGKVWYLRIRPFDERLVNIRTPAQSKAEAKELEVFILTACRSGDYRGLDPRARETAVRMFKNQRWPIPADLKDESPVQEDLSLWRGIELCLNYPEVRNSRNRERHQQAFVHIVRILGKDLPVREIWIPTIKEYQIRRANEGAAPSTINKERAALSRMFQVLIEMNLADRNPVRMVRGCGELASRREVYLSFGDFNAIVGVLPGWTKPIIRTLFFTGMRRGEALGLTWENVDLDSRIIRLRPEQTKERKPKRIPIHRVLVPTIEAAGKVRSISTDRVFLTTRGKSPASGSLRKPWVEAVTAVGLNPRPTIHDLRHVWKTNAVRSGMDFEIREAILGHYTGIALRYGRLSDQDLVRAVDRMKFDEGKTEIWVTKR